MTPKKQCRVCGKDYEPCHSTKLQPGVFRWREVACSPECGAIYLQRIQESRGVVPKDDKKLRSKKRTVKSVEVEVVTDSEADVNTLDHYRV